MESIANCDGEQRPSKRIRIPTRPYKPESSTDSIEEERMIAQAIANSRKDRGIEPHSLSTIPFGPTFYPTVEEFSGDPLTYLETIRSEAEKYGEYWHNYSSLLSAKRRNPQSEALCPH
jgi:hypothetical protein